MDLYTGWGLHSTAARRARNIIVYRCVSFGAFEATEPTIAIACKRFFVAEHLVRRCRAARRGGTRQNRQKRGQPANRPAWPLLSQLKSYTHRGASRFLCILHMYIPISYQYKLHIFIGIRNDCVPMRQRLKLTVPEQPACLLTSPPSSRCSLSAPHTHNVCSCARR